MAVSSSATAAPRVDAGQVWIYYGSPSGLQLAAGTMLDQSMVAGAAAEADDLFGWSLTTGRFNSDTYPDLAVGAIGEDGGAGIAFYFYSNATGVTTTGAGFVKLTDLGDVSQANAWLGYAVEANDFDGNGTDDLAIGAPQRTVASLTNAGRVYVLFSTATGLNPSFVVRYDALGLGLEAESDAYFGWSLTSGNYWTTKASHDLAIGEPQFDQSSQIDAGRALVLRLDPPPVKPDSESGVYVQSAPTAINILRQGVNGNEQAEPGDQFGYALASGNYTGDALDEIAAAAPFDAITQPGLGTLPFSGTLTVYTGWPSGPMAWMGYFRVLDVDTQNDHTIGGETFGTALCFGRFDNSGKAALAIGAPGRDYESYLDGGTHVSDAGAVYISAPWRQPTSRPHRSSVVWDCDQNIAYAQRPFDPVNPASTTKALTLLLACEAIEVGFVDEFYEYTVDWTRTPNIGGSLVPLYWHEQMEFHNLMKTMMTRSGNDAGYALGDIMTGETAVWSGYTTTLTEFADIMNAKKTQLGLSSGTYMNNPSGMGYGFDPEHVTNAMDWVKLAHGAMQNQCVRDIVGEDCWEVNRDVPLGLQAWIDVGPPAPLQTTFCNGFVDGLQSGGFPATGVKGGSTTSAQKTGLGSASALGGEVYAAWFGVRIKDNPPGAAEGDGPGTGRDLLQVGRAACDADIFAPPPPGPPGPYVTLQGLSTQWGTGRAACAGLLDNDLVAGAGDMRLFATAQVLATPTASIHFAIERNSEVEVRPSEQLSFNYERIQSFEGAEFVNMGTTAIDLTVTASHPTGAVWMLTVPPGQAASIPAAAVGDQDYMLTIQNTSSAQTAHLSMHQLGLTFDALLGDTREAPRSQTRAITRTGGAFAADQVCLYYAGQDAGPGNLVGISLQSADVPTDAPDPVVFAPGAPILRILANTPNPFNPSTTLRYQLAAAGIVDLAIYDLAGRRIRQLLVHESKPAGEHIHVWDGRDDAGRRVASGVYVVQGTANGESASQRIVLLK